MPLKYATFRMLAFMFLLGSGFGCIDTKDAQTTDSIGNISNAIDPVATTPPDNTKEISKEELKTIAIEPQESTVAQLKQIEINPAVDNIPIGVERKFEVVAIFNDGTKAIVTSKSTLKSSDTQILGPGAESSSFLGLAPGEVKLTAIFSGTETSALVEVKDIAIDTLKVQPSVATVGISQKLYALAVYTDGTVIDVSSQTVWTSNSRRCIFVASGCMR